MTKHEGEGEWRLWLVLGILALVVAYLIAFVVENSRSVKIHWVFTSSTSSVIWLIVVSLLIGVGAGLLISALYRRRRRRRQPVAGAGEVGDPLGHLGGRDEAERQPS